MTREELTDLVYSAVDNEMQSLPIKQRVAGYDGELGAWHNASVYAEPMTTVEAFRAELKRLYPGCDFTAAWKRPTPEIVVVYRSCDRVNKRRSFKTLEGARKFAQKWVGKHPEIGSGYAVSADGIGTITLVAGDASLADLFPAKE